MTEHRLIGVDAARGAALLGVIAVHALHESHRDGSPTWSFSLFAGRSAALFAVLAGVGIALMTGRRRVPLAAGRASAAGLAARALAIGGFGLALGYANASLGAVILPYLAVMFLLAIPLVFLPTRIIAVLGVLIAVGMPVLGHVWRPRLPVPDLLNPTIGSLIDDPLGLLSELSLTGEYPALPWMAYLCAGLVIGRLDLTRQRVAIALTAVGAVLATASAYVSSYLDPFAGAHIWPAQPGSYLTGPETAELLILGGDGTTPASTWWWLAIDAPHTGTPFDLMGTTGVAIAVLGVMLLASKMRSMSALLMPLAAAGGMTLTLYAAHIMFINSDYDTYSAATGCLVQIGAALLSGLAWRATIGRGPLEAITTAVAARARRYATRQPDPQPAQGSSRALGSLTSIH